MKTNTLIWLEVPRFMWNFQLAISFRCRWAFTKVVSPRRILWRPAAPYKTRYVGR